MTTAARVIILMGSAAETAKETVDCLTAKGEKVGLVNVHLYHPFFVDHFLNAIPKICKRLAVLDRTREPGSMGEPLYQDVCTIYKQRGIPMEIVGGRYGFSSKDTTPGQILAVCENFKADLQAAFFTLTGVIPIDQAVTEMKDAIYKTYYKKKGQEVADMNNASIDHGINELTEIPIPFAQSICKHTSRNDFKWTYPACFAPLGPANQPENGTLTPHPVPFSAL